MAATNMVERFARKFGCEPEFYVSAPGRVNLIGEHIDYSGYGVLPMALDQSIYAYVRVVHDSDTIVLSNADSVLYEDYTVERTKLVIDRKQPKWFHYFLCGFRGMSEHLQEGGDVHGLDSTSQTKKIGLRVLICGSIPASAGLSSSSAMVCCAALVTLRAITGRGFDAVSRADVAELCARCERYIGTEGGGMDQAICLLAEVGKAKYVTFAPLRTENVVLPADALFVVANSCVQMNKAAVSNFNERVVECRIAAQVVAARLGVPWKKVRKLAELAAALGKSLVEMPQVIDENLHKHAYTRAEVCELLQIDDGELTVDVLSHNTSEMQSFKLFERAMHVYSEAARVLNFRDVCAEVGNLKGDDALLKLGALMNESHESCRKLYECSCAELDELVEACKAAGAFGSRLTGAGWGGCVVSLISGEKKDEFIEKLRGSFYVKSEERKKAIDGATQPALFATSPAGGANVTALLEAAVMQ